MSKKHIIKNYFRLNKDVHIIIYGAGGLGLSVSEKLKKNGFNISGFIDKNGCSTSEITDSPVYLLNEAAEYISPQEENIIIICLHNAMWHTETAEILNNMGYDRIIFLPLNGSFNKIHAQEMEKAYNCIMDGNYKEIGDIPTYTAITDKQYSCEDGVLETTENTVTAWIDLLLIYTNNELKNRGGEKTHIFGDVSIFGLKPYIELFNFCKTGKGDVNSYIEAFKSVQNKKDEYSIEEFIQDRVNLYTLLRKELDKGMEYFINSAPLIRWNDERKHFNVIEGHHRLIFLMCEGHRLVPVKMCRKDYTKWENSDVYNECINYIKNNKINCITAPVFHPGFYLMDCKTETFLPNAMTSIFSIFSTENISGYNVMDLSETQGYYARGLRNLGCKNVSCIIGKKDIELTKLLNRLSYSDDINVFNDFCEIPEKEYDIIAADYDKCANLTDWYMRTRKYFICRIKKDSEDEFFLKLKFKSRKELNRTGYSNNQVSVWLITL